MPTAGPQFQPVLPGMGRVKRVAPKAVHELTTAAQYSGPAPGQLVMGVHDLAAGREVDQGFHRVPSSRMPGATRIVSKGTTTEPYEVDPHGYVQEGFGSPPAHDRAAGGVLGGAHPSAADLYGTHGGRYAHTLREALEREANGETPSDLGFTAGDVKVHDDQVRQVKRHWNSQPVVQFPTSQLVHSTQGHEETEGEREPDSWDEHGNSRYSSQAVGEGRARIETIKGDLAKGGKIRKPIWMTKVNGRYFQLDGHHRMVAAREMGLSHVPVRLWDQDANPAPPQAPARPTVQPSRTGVVRFPNGMAGFKSS